MIYQSEEHEEELEAKGSGRHGLSSAGTVLRQVPVQCPERREVTEGDAAPEEALVAEGSSPSLGTSQTGCGTGCDTVLVMLKMQLPKRGPRQSFLFQAPQ